MAKYYVSVWGDGFIYDSATRVFEADSERDAVIAANEAYYKAGKEYSESYEDGRPYQCRLEILVADESDHQNGKLNDHTANWRHYLVTPITTFDVRRAPERDDHD
jgi:hypothetical protein